jgi:hypothetical protein
MQEDVKDLQRQYRAGQDKQNKRLKKFGEVYSKLEDLVRFCSSLLVHHLKDTLSYRYTGRRCGYGVSEA